MHQFKQYNEFNKSLWFLFPLIAELGSKANRTSYLIDEYLINTFINPEEKKIYVVYKNVPEVIDIEPMLTNEYLIDVEEYVSFTCYIYQLTKPEEPKEGSSPESFIKYNNEVTKYEEDLEVFNLFIAGKYSRLSNAYKKRIVDFFYLRLDDFVSRVVRVDEKLYLSVHKQLGCFAKKCSCKIDTHVEAKEDKNGKTIKREVCNEKQEYQSCPNFKRFEMPSRYEEGFELEEKPDLEKESYYEPKGI